MPNPNSPRPPLPVALRCTACIIDDPLHHSNCMGTARIDNTYIQRLLSKLADTLTDGH